MAVALMLDSGYLPFGFAKKPIELSGIPGREQVVAQCLAANQASDPTQRFHVVPIRHFRPYEQKKKSHRLAIEGIEGYRRGAGPCRQS
jgi:hypothetical protein